MATLAELVTYLQGLSLGVPGTDLFRDYLPDTPDVVTTLDEYAGAAPVHTMGPQAAGLVYPMVQFVTRGAARDVDTPRARAKAIFDALDGLANVTIGGVRYVSIFAVQQPFLMNRDPLERVLFAFNARVCKVPS